MNLVNEMSKENELFNNDELNVNPLNEFSGCHEYIVDNFRLLQTLLDLLEQQSDSREIRQMTLKLLAFFKDVVLEHHAEEEQELFVAVMECAEKGVEANEARQSIKRLVAEHRELEAMWKHLEPALKRISKGKTAELDVELAKELSVRYLAHAAYEEQYFLPLSARILSKNEMSALGLSLHMRHEDDDMAGNYV